MPVAAAKAAENHFGPVVLDFKDWQRHIRENAIAFIVMQIRAGPAVSPTK